MCIYVTVTKIERKVIFFRIDFPVFRELLNNISMLNVHLKRIIIKIKVKFVKELECILQRLTVKWKRSRSYDIPQISVRNKIKFWRFSVQKIRKTPKFLNEIIGCQILAWVFTWIDYLWFTFLMNFIPKWKWSNLRPDEFRVLRFLLSLISRLPTDAQLSGNKLWSKENSMLFSSVQVNWIIHWREINRFNCFDLIWFVRYHISLLHIDAIWVPHCTLHSEW